MTGVLAIIARVYAFLLRLYPGSFRNEFEEQMLLDLSDMAADAWEKGRFSFALFCLRELMDFPFSLLRAHWEQGRMFKVLRSQPVNYGLRGATGFGLGFGAAAISLAIISSWLITALDPAMQYASVWLYDMFQRDIGSRLFWGLQSLLRSGLGGMFFGLLFAMLASRRSKYSRYMLAGAAGWFIPDVVQFILSDSFGWSYYLSAHQGNILGLMIGVLVGACWGAIFCLAESEQKEPFWYFVAGIVGYPLGTYLFIKLLLSLWLEITPWFFICLVLLMVVLIGGVIFVVVLSNRKMVWMLLAGAAGYLTFHRLGSYIAYQFLHLPLYPLNTPMPGSAFIVYDISWAISQAIFGVVLGMILGLIYGYQRKNSQPQLEGV